MATFSAIYCISIGSFPLHSCTPVKLYTCKVVHPYTQELSCLINSSSQPINRFTETIHYFYLLSGIVARKCQEIDFYQT